MRIFPNVDALRAVEGESLGVSDWYMLDQRTVDVFAEASGDYQWIHTDPERAAAGPFGTAIAHGYLTLARIPTLLDTMYQVEGVGFRVNYGIDSLRFTAPVPVGARLRVAATLQSTEDRGGGVLARVRCDVAIEGSDKPACVAVLLFLLFPERGDRDSAARSVAAPSATGTTSISRSSS